MRSILAIALLLLMGLTIPSEPGGAQDAPPAPAQDFSSLKAVFSGRIDKIIDGQTLLLKDNKIIRLTSLDIPPDEISAQAARDVLIQELPEQTEITAYQTRKSDRGRVNRMDQHLAHIVRKKDGLWINGIMLERGMARVIPTESNKEMIPDMFLMENRARIKKMGIWESYPLLTPENAQTGIGGFHVIEGIVQKSASAQNNVYLNFGDNWKTDFTVMITSDIRKKLARQNIDVMNLSGKKIRARGEIRSYNGAFMELTTPESIEIFP